MALSAVPEWEEKLEGEKQVEDEFTCPGVLRGALLDLKSTVERVFRVILNIGGGEDAFTPQDGLIWLQLKGRKGEVEAAKVGVRFQKVPHQMHISYYQFIIKSSVY